MTCSDSVFLQLLKLYIWYLWPPNLWNPQNQTLFSGNSIFALLFMSGVWVMAALTDLAIIVSIFGVMAVD